MMMLLALVAGGLTADQAVARALEHSPTLEALSFRRVEAREHGKAENALENPQLRITNFRTDRLQNSTLHPLGGLTLGARWNLPNPMVNAARTTQADRAVDEVDADTDAERRQVEARVRSLHATVQSLDAQLALARSAVELRQRLSELSRRRVAAQAARGLELSLAALDELESRAHALDLEHDRRRAAAELGVLVQLERGVGLELEGEGPQCVLAEPSLEALLRRAAERDPEARALAAKVGQVEAQASQARRSLIPWFDWVQGGYSLQSDGNPAYGIFGVGMTVPLLNFEGSRLDELAAKAGRLQARLSARRRELAIDVEASATDVRDGALLVARYQEAEPKVVAQSQRQLDESLAAGEVSLVELALVQARTLSARRAGLKAALNCQLAVIELARLVGQ